LYSILIVVVIIGIMWFLMIRPQQRRNAEQRAMRQAVGEGAEVMLTSGIYGTVIERTDDYVLVTVADGVTLKVAPAAIGQVIPQPEPEDADTAVALPAPEESTPPPTHEEN